MKKLILVLATASMLGACTQTEAGERTVFTDYGKPLPKSYEPGFYWYNPWSTDAINMNVQQRKWGDTTETYTRDVQKSDIRFVMNYHLRPDRAHVMYERVGQEWADNILPQTVYEVIKNEIGKVDAVTLVATRGEVADRVTAALKERLARQDIILDSFDLTDISFTDTFEQAVEAKQVAVQNAITAKNKTVQVEEQAKQRVIQAKGEAEALSITSTALKGDPKLIELKAIEKWDGKLPQYQTGPTPFIKAN